MTPVQEAIFEWEPHDYQAEGAFCKLAVMFGWRW
jgi:hypothetical protein